jgi:Domain of unknown function (DUF4157)
MGNQRLIQTQTAANDRKQYLDKRTQQPESSLEEVLGSRAASHHFRAQLQRHQAEGASVPNPLHSILPSISSISPRAIQAKPMFRGLSHELTSALDSRGMVIQAKMTIGAPGDQYEQEADRVAEQVVQKMHAPSTPESTLGGPLQHQDGKEDGHALRMKPLRQHSPMGGMAATQDLESSIHRARGGGQPLEAGLQRKLGQAMGTDFSGVRVHTDHQSDQLNRSIQAKAFTTGQDVFFRQGAYQPGSRGGQELIAHELTHVVQQNGGASGDTVQRVLFDTGHGLYINYTYVLLATGEIVLVSPEYLPTAWPHEFQENIGEWIYYDPHLLIAPQPIPSMPQPLPQPDIELDTEGELAQETKSEEGASDLKRDDEPKFETVQDLMNNANYVRQDSEKDHYYYIGQAVAYTYNLSTCTAIALFHEETGLSYLRHADAMTKPEQVKASVNKYIQEVLNKSKRNVDLKNEIKVTIFATSGQENRESSFENIRKGIEKVGTNDVVLNLFENAKIEEKMDRQQHVVVGGGVAPRKIDPVHIYSTLEFALSKLIEGEDQNFSVYGAKILEVVKGARNNQNREIVTALGEMLQRALDKARENKNNEEVVKILQEIRLGEEYKESVEDAEVENEVDKRMAELMKASKEQNKKMSWGELAAEEDEIRKDIMNKKKR